MRPATISREHFLSIVEAAIQAPSADNHHPFSFEQSGERVRVWKNESFRTAPFHRRVLTLISLGAVVENMVLRAQSLGLNPSVHCSPSPEQAGLAAEIKLLEGSVTDDELALAIPHRHTNRRFFHGPRMTREQQRLLEKDAEAIDGARLVWLDQWLARAQALSLIRLAEAERFRCKDLHQELFSSIRFDVGWTRTVDEGLPPGSLEVERPLQAPFQALRRWGLMHLLARLGAHHLLGFRAGDAPCRFAPHLAVIAAILDVEPGGVAVGRALERVWLRATRLGMAFQPLAASTLLALDGYTAVRPAIRQKLAQGWERITPGTLPLIVFRLGWSSPVRIRSARRALASYLH